MNRLQRKCVVAATGLHLLLALILFVGPGFFSPGSKSDNVPDLNFIPVKTVDSLLSGGGNPNAKPPAPIVTPVQPVAPPAPPVVDKTPIAEPAPKVKPKPIEPLPKENSLSDEVAKKPVRKLPDVSTKPVKRSTTNAATTAKAEANAQAREAQQRNLAAIRSATAGIQENLSGSTEIELKGPGGGGVPYANFLAAVKKVYTDAWLVPEGITDDSATVAASITIARDSSVISAKIVRRSGNADVDQSVQRTLDRVRYAAPLPDDATESERTVTINFNVKSKLLG